MIRVTQGPWTAVWEGGRLADIYHAESDTPLDCTQVGPYSFAWTPAELEKHRAGIGRKDVAAALREWIAEDGECFIRNALPYS